VIRLERLRGGEVIAAAGAALLAAALFMPWFGKVSPYCVPLAGHHCGRNFDAWKVFGFTDLVLAAAAICGFGMALLAGASSKTDAAITSACFTVPVAALGTLLALHRVIDPVGKLDPRYGLYVGLVAVAAVTYGSWRAVRNERPSRVAGSAPRRPASKRRSRSSSD
jgi:hypothetical protein